MLRVRFLWITDPWWMLDHAGDTTLRLAEEAEILGHSNAWSDVRSIRLENNVLRLTTRSLRFRDGKPFLGSPRDQGIARFDSIQWRMDPPVDASYLHPLSLLQLGLRALPRGSRRPQIVNPPEILFSTTEKSETALVRTRAGIPLSAPSVISSQWERLARFGLHEGKTVVKPLHLCQSKGVALLDWRRRTQLPRIKKQLKDLTDGFRNPVLLQRFLPEISKGELRLWFLDGKMLAAARKFPLEGDFRVNMDLGSRIAPAGRFTAKEKAAISAISRHLRATKIRLSAIDLIGGHMTDFNFTSPGLLRQLEKVNERNLAEPIIRALTRILAQ